MYLQDESRISLVTSLVRETQTFEHCLQLILRCELFVVVFLFFVQETIRQPFCTADDLVQPALFSYNLVSVGLAF